MKIDNFKWIIPALSACGLVLPVVSGAITTECLIDYFPMTSLGFIATQAVLMYGINNYPSVQKTMLSVSVFLALALCFLMSISLGDYRDQAGNMGLIQSVNAMTMGLGVGWYAMLCYCGVSVCYIFTGGEEL